MQNVAKYRTLQLEKNNLRLKALEQILHTKTSCGQLMVQVGTCITPFKKPQRWIGQNTFPILLLNDDNMIEGH